MVKFERSSKRINHSGGIDRISTLPAPLLSHILSLLPTKYAVATSVLSRRWKFLWTSITNLEFDNEEAQQRYATLGMKRMKFTQFVNRVLLRLNSPCIQSFQLKCHHEHCDPSYIDSWIFAAMRRISRKLELHLVMAQSVELPLSHFHFKTLAVLNLNGDIHFKIADAASISFSNLLTVHLSGIEFTISSNCSVSFPSLKDLLLDCVRYTNEESVHKLFASCSALENLVIKRSRPDNALHLIISIPSLISLKIRFWDLPLYWRSRVHIDTPALKYLYVEDDSMCCFISKNLSSLLEASIESEDSFTPFVDSNMYNDNIFKFFGGLTNVKFLSFTGYTLEAISSMSRNFAPVFHNLTRLEMNSYLSSSWSVVYSNLLEGMTNLEHLVFKVMDPYQADSWWMEPRGVPMCLLHSVTTISFNEIICEIEDELEMVRYFMKNARVLKRLTIDRIDGTEAEKLEFMQKLLMSPRGSQECLVHVGVGR